MKANVSLKLLLLCALSVFMTAAADAIPIDLSAPNFTADATVTVTPGGFSATLAEDLNLSAVYLSNDPGAPINPNPVVLIAGLGVSLIFDYDFVEGAGNNDDEFGAFIIDAATGNSAGLTFEFFTQSTNSGTVSFDLSTLTGQTLGLQFQLSAIPGDVDLNSIVTVSNVRLESPAAIPEPSTWLLFAIGVVGVAIRVLRLRRKSV